LADGVAGTNVYDNRSITHIYTFTHTYTCTHAGHADPRSTESIQTHTHAQTHDSSSGQCGQRTDLAACLQCNGTESDECVWATCGWNCQVCMCACVCSFISLYCSITHHIHYTLHSTTTHITHYTHYTLHSTLYYTHNTYTLRTLQGVIKDETNFCTGADQWDRCAAWMDTHHIDCAVRPGVCVCVCVRVYVACVCVCVSNKYVCRHTYIYTHTYTYSHTHTHSHIHIFTHTHTHTHTHVDTHTHTCATRSVDCLCSALCGY
jgi:hypothetical protein